MLRPEVRIADFPLAAAWLPRHRIEWGRFAVPTVARAKPGRGTLPPGWTQVYENPATRTRKLYTDRQLMQAIEELSQGLAVEPLVRCAFHEANRHAELNEEETRSHQLPNGSAHKSLSL